MIKRAEKCSILYHLYHGPVGREGNAVAPGVEAGRQGRGTRPSSSSSVSATVDGGGESMR